MAAACSVGVVPGGCASLAAAVVDVGVAATVVVADGAAVVVADGVAAGSGISGEGAAVVTTAAGVLVATGGSLVALAEAEWDCQMRQLAKPTAKTRRTPTRVRDPDALASG